MTRPNNTGKYTNGIHPKDIWSARIFMPKNIGESWDKYFKKHFRKKK